MRVLIASVWGTVFRSTAAAAVAAGTTDKIAFRTKSKEEVLDDGYKWRKYGKKSVKNSPNPRYKFRSFLSTNGIHIIRFGLETGKERLI